MSAVTTRQPITIRDNVTPPLTLPLASGATVYPGTWAVLNNSGYVVNYTSTGNGQIVGVVQIEDASRTATANGNLAAPVETNLVQLYVDGFYTTEDASGLTAASVGRTAYLSDNNQVTDDPATGYIPVGVITKYFSSTKCEIAIGKYFSAAAPGVYNLKFKLQDFLNYTDTSTGSNLGKIANPFGTDVVLYDAFINIVTAATSAVSGTCGIVAASSLNSAAAVSVITFGTAGLYWMGSGTTGAQQTWNSTQLLGFSSTGALSASSTSALDGIVELTVRRY
jgi:hypothetical protein